jgi:hypothetical protein
MNSNVATSGLLQVFLSSMLLLCLLFLFFFCAKVECLQRVVNADVDARVQTRVRRVTS